MLKPKWIILATALILGAALTLFLRRDRYEVVHPHRGDLQEAVYGLGKVKSDQRFEVIVGVLSTVTRRFVNEGDRVAKGAPLLELESHAVFRSPFAGTVTFASVYPGETVVPHTPVFRVENLDRRYIELSLEQQAAIRVRAGQTAKVSLESIRGNVLEGKVTALYPRNDEFLARVDVAGLEPSILPGMTADVSIEIGKIHDALLVPAKAVQNGMVSARRGGHWQKVKVDVGHVDGLNAEIKGNALSAGDELRVRKED